MNTIVFSLAVLVRVISGNRIKHLYEREGKNYENHPDLSALGLEMPFLTFPASFDHRVLKQRGPISKPMEALAALQLALHRTNSHHPRRISSRCSHGKVSPSMEASLSTPPMASVEDLPKNGKTARPITHLESAGFVLPHPEKRDRVYELPPYCGGEDAYFIESDSGVLGIADGVGGWTRYDIDPGLFSRELMKHAAEEARAGVVDPVENMKAAHNKTFELGSSTALVLSFFKATEIEDQHDHKTRIRVANLGDSGFLHLRNGKVLLRSTPQQSGFNCPFQLLAAGSDRGQLPCEADIYEIEDLEDGDVLVLGTDGVFDNAFPNEIAQMVYGEENERTTPKTLDPELLAKKIGQQVEILAMDAKRESPFSIESLSQGHNFLGGKLDDITVIVAVVRAGEESLSTGDGALKPDEKSLTSDKVEEDNLKTENEDVAEEVVQKAGEHEAAATEARQNTDDDANEKAEGEVNEQAAEQASPSFEVHDRVMVAQSIMSDSEEPVRLDFGHMGTLLRFDEDGDALIDFDKFEESQWVFSNNFGILELPFRKVGSEIE